MNTNFWNKLTKPAVKRTTILFAVIAPSLAASFDSSGSHALFAVFFSIGIFLLSGYLMANIKAKEDFSSETQNSQENKLFGSPMFPIVYSVAVFFGSYLVLVAQTSHWIIRAVFLIVAIGILFWQDKITQKAIHAEKSPLSYF